MARRSKDVTITAEGRDKGRVFRIEEKSAADAEEWGVRVLTAISRSRPDLPEEAYQMPTNFVMALGFARMLVGMSFDDGKPLMAEMMECVKRVPDPGQPLVSRPLVEDDTEEVATRLFLRKEVLELHMGFTLDEMTSKVADQIQALANMLRTRMSPPQSDALSAEA